MRTVLALLLVAPFALSCADSPTQVVVRVEVSDAERNRAASLRVRIWDSDGTIVRDQSVPPGAYEVPLRARDDDASRSYRVVVELVADTGCALARQIAMGGYAAGEKLAIGLRFDDACADVRCGLEQTCIEGVCEAACFVPGPLDEVGRSVPSACASGSDAGVVAPGPVFGDVSISDLEPTSARIRWTTVPDATGRVEYGDSVVFGQSTGGETRLLPVHSQVVRGLTSGSPVHYRLLASDAAGGSSTLEGCFVTPE